MPITAAPAVDIPLSVLLALCLLLSVLSVISPAFSLPSAALLFLISFRRQRALFGPGYRVTEHLGSHRKLRLYLIFILIRSVNQFLTRLVRNGGWKADPPKWSRVKGRGDIVLITGGSMGIGKELVELLAKRTENIINLDLAEPSYKSPGVRYFKCDVTDPQQIKQIAETIRKEIGYPTILINNAGIVRANTILNAKPEELLVTYKVNVLGCHNILREFLPHIIKINHGHIMTTASSASYATVPQLGEYTCSKSAVLSLHETLNGELTHRYKAKNVRTSIICPLKVSTQLGDTLNDTDNQFLTPTLTAKYVAYEMDRILSSGLSEHFIAPAFASVSLPLLRAAPDWYRWFLDTVGKTNLVISDQQVAKQKKIYTLVDSLQSAHETK